MSHEAELHVGLVWFLAVGLEGQRLRVTESPTPIPALPSACTKKICFTCTQRRFFIRTEKRLKHIANDTNSYCNGTLDLWKAFSPRARGGYNFPAGNCNPFVCLLFAKWILNNTPCWFYLTLGPVPIYPGQGWNFE